MPVLLLNSTFEPLHVCTVRRGIQLIYDDKVTVIEETGKVWHASSFEIEVPSVIRLHKYVNVPRKTKVALCKNAVLARDGHRCAYCGEKAETIDHVIPKSRGGSHSWDNCVASCKRCNFKKGNKLNSEMGYKLLITPKQPKGTRGLLVARQYVKDFPEWEQYLPQAA